MSYDGLSGDLDGSDAPSAGDGSERPLTRLVRRARVTLVAVRDKVRTHVRTWPRRYVEQQEQVYDDW